MLPPLQSSHSSASIPPFQGAILEMFSKKPASRASGGSYGTPATKQHAGRRSSDLENAWGSGSGGNRRGDGGEASVPARSGGGGAISWQQRSG